MSQIGLEDVATMLKSLGIEGERIHVDPENNSVFVTEVVDLARGDEERTLVISVQLLLEGDILTIAVPLLPFSVDLSGCKTLCERLLRASLSSPLVAFGATREGYLAAFSELTAGEVTPQNLWRRYGAVIEALAWFLKDVLLSEKELEDRLYKEIGSERSWRD
ncbi:MAG TPA: hypothetical protein ENG69_01810 [Candidatus Korarchaeota archaeon]|nr:hypothetical protein [Candidatus Korarchaeota archaeon]